MGAWYNKSFYVDVANNWKGSGSLYMFVMCFIASLVAIAPIALVCAQASNDKNLPNFLSQVPQITFENGQVNIDKPCPYQIKDSQGTVVAEFRCNETGSPKLADGGTNPPIIVTRDVLYLGSPSTATAGEPQTYQFSDLKGMWEKATFNGTDILHWIQTAIFWIPFGLFALSMPMIFLGHLFQMLIYAGIAQMIFSNKQVAITYGTGMRLSAMAMTPAILITTVLHAIEVMPALKAVAAVGTLLMTVVSIVLAITCLVVAAQAAAPAAPSAPSTPAAPA
jgi:hypothetical protein